ncbi:MAG: response regulator transcription factor [Actinomycetota bacterium]|nr:response regulator transcription factor [Actinomycetota bacterium]
MPTRILIVDDVPELRQIFRVMLEGDERFEIVGEAADGLDAIAKAGDLKPDVVLLDIAMPKLDGIAAIPEIHRASPGVKIMVLSGFQTAKLTERALASCASAFLEKGASSDKIVSLLGKVASGPAKKVCLSA